MTAACNPVAGWCVRHRRWTCDLSAPGPYPSAAAEAEAAGRDQLEHEREGLR